MGDDRFKIFVHRLKEGEIESIEETFDPGFMGVDEEEIKFEAPVLVKGEAFVCGGNFVLRLGIKTSVDLLCSICNSRVSVALGIASLLHTQKVEEIRSGLFQMADLLREAILLELPHRAECNLGNCPEREEIKKYFSKES